MVIYGRRRVGKTELSREFIKGKKAVYIFIEIKPETLIFKDLEESLGEVLKIKPRIDSWDELFNLIFDQKDKLIVVFDEFQNLSKVNPGIFSKFQKYWDLNHNQSQHMFLIIGSYVGMIKKIFKDTKEPLFGRATGYIDAESREITKQWNRKTNAIIPKVLATSENQVHGIKSGGV